MGRLEGKSVIITGAGSGIGRAASLMFTKEGARLIAVDRTDGVKETVDLVKGDLRRLPFRKGSQGKAYSLDVLEHLDEAGVREVLIEARRVLLGERNRAAATEKR